MTQIHDAAPQAERRDLPQPAALMAYAGGLPLFIGAILFWFVNEALSASLLPIMAGYGIALLAFFGGVRWGVAVMRADGPSFAQLMGAAAPLMAALVLILIPDLLVKITTLAVLVPLLLWDDLRATRRGSGAPDWYLGVRAPLTGFIEVSLLLILVRMIVAPV